MDPHDKEFETFLRQFRLRMPGPVKETVSLQRRSPFRLVLAAAAIVVLAFAGVMMRNHSRVSSPAATVAAPGAPSFYKVGERIEAGTVVQSNSAKGLTLALDDGSQVEMQTQSELVLEAASDGTRVRLNDGSILVTAAKQGAGHLYVQTRDAMVSVVGTVFLVHAEQSGTRVAVVEGEVHVQQGADLKKLLPGDQVASNSLMALKPLSEEISWSQNSTKYIAMLPQTPAVVPAQAPPVNAGGNSEFDMLQKYNDAFKVADAATNLLPYKVQANYVKLTNDSVRTLITVQFLTKELAFRDEGGAQVATTHLTGNVIRSDNRRVPSASFSEDVVVQFPSQKSFNEALDRPNLYQTIADLPPGKYKLHLTVEDKNAQSIGISDVLLSPPNPDSMLSSSLILASSVTDLPPNAVGKDVFGLGNKKVKPNVAGVYRQDEALNVWQEFYGLTADPTTRKPSATIELLILQNQKEIKRLVSRFSETSYTNSVPLAEIAPGQYEVQVKVMDDLAKRSFVTAKQFSVVAISAPQRPSQLTSAPQAGNSVSVVSGKALFDRTCTQCHSRDVATKLSWQFSYSDRQLLDSKKAELQRMLVTFARQYPPAVILQSEIGALEARADASRALSAGFVSGHLTGFGVIASNVDMRAIAEYLFEAAALQTNPSPSVPQPPKPEDTKKEDADVAGERILNTACTTCHDLGPLAGRTGDRKYWEDTVTRMAVYGASVKDTDLPVLVDYLFKHYGPPKEAPKPPASDTPLQPPPGRFR